MTADLHAEAVVAACAAASPHGAELAHQRVTADQFTSPALRTVFAAAANIPPFPTPDPAAVTAWARARAAGDAGEPIWPSERRLHAIAQRAGITTDDLQRLLAIRPVADDTTGHYAQRVTDAADRRTLERDTVALHELVRVGDDRRARELAQHIGHALAEAS